MINANEFIERTSFTDIMAPTKKISFNNVPKPTDKPKVPLLNISMNTSKDGVICSSQKDFLGNESFSFEKSKLQQLKMEGTPPMDVNDESITKLKNEIFLKFQNVLINFEKISNIARILSVALLFIEILEMIAMFFMLLYLSLKMVPSEHILLWVGSSLFLSLIQMFLLIKAIIASQSKDVKTHKEYIYAGVLFFVFLVIVSIIGLKAILFGSNLFDDELKPEVKDTLKHAQRIILIPILIKITFQVIFFILEWIQMKNLRVVNGNCQPSTEPNSRNYVLG